jgi:hypothetical protein
MASTFTIPKLLDKALQNVFIKSSSSSHITGGERLEWHEVGSANHEMLITKLQHMYWLGVRRELMEIVRTLKEWRDDELKDVALDDEKDHKIYGFDTFIDQVSEVSRGFAVEYGQFSRST